MEIANLSLAFSAGLLAVLAPCALPMLPSFVSYYMNTDENRSYGSALTFGFVTVAGFLSVFLVIGIFEVFTLFTYRADPAYLPIILLFFLQARVN